MWVVALLVGLGCGFGAYMFVPNVVTGTAASDVIIQTSSPIIIAGTMFGVVMAVIRG